jgi:TolA-binding protein
MQATTSSKPLALVIIGLILGASLGLGSGYAVFYPQMVRDSNKSIEDRLQEMEDGLDQMGVQMVRLNSSIGDIQGSLGSIMGLTESMNTLNNRILTLEATLSQVNGKINGLEGKVNTLTGEYTSLEGDLSSLQDDIEGLQAEFTDAMAGFGSVQEQFQAVDAKVLDVQEKVSQDTAYERFRAWMGNPSSANVASLTDMVHSVLMAENSAYSTWAKAYGETTAKILLTPVLDGKMGKIVWNRVSVAKVSGSVYQVRLETYTSLEFSAASVTVPKLKLEARANVNPVTGEVASFSWTVVDII